jgi:predicted transposase YbfD/YdcC
VRTREELAATAEEREDAKAEAELGVAPRLLRRAEAAGALRGRLVSGDALYCQKALCRQLREAGADYLFAVKANQPGLLDDVRLLFGEPPAGERFVEARTVDKHGGRLEERRLRASAALAEYLRAGGWADAGLALEVAATVRWPGQPERAERREVRYFLSSLGPATPPDEALRAVRRHWEVENRLHWPRDVVLGEDACRVRTGHAPQVLAGLRNAAVGLLRAERCANLAAALREHAWAGPAAILRLLGLAPP